MLTTILVTGRRLHRSRQLSSTCTTGGLLSKELLTDLMWPYEEIDIDTGGMEGTLRTTASTSKRSSSGRSVRPYPRARMFRQIIREWTTELEALHGACQEIRVIAGGMGCYHQLSGRPLETIFE